MALKFKPRDRQRGPRVRAWTAKLALVAALAGGAWAAGHDRGATTALDTLEATSVAAERFQREAEQAARRAAELEAELAARTAALDNATASAEQFKFLYEEAAPAPVQEILTEALARIHEGLSPQRIAFAVSQAAEPRGCTPAFTRRLMARTARHDGPSTQARLDEFVTVTVSGTGAEGGRAAWFDPSLEVTARFVALGGEPPPVTGRLPLQHAFVVKGREYRMLMTAGARGFVEVTVDRCDVPAPFDRTAAEEP